MGKDIYSEILTKLTQSASVFLPDDTKMIEEIDEDFTTIMADHDISTWKTNIDGTVKGVGDLVSELDMAVNAKDKQKCMESIAMLRVAIADIASAYSNAMDTMENLVVLIRESR